MPTAEKCICVTEKTTPADVLQAAGNGSVILEVGDASYRLKRTDAAAAALYCDTVDDSEHDLAAILSDAEADATLARLRADRERYDLPTDRQ